MGGNRMICDICRRSPCHPNCPNHKCNKVGSCDKCGNDLYEEYEIWTDNDGNKFCSEDCAKDYYGIKEMEY